MDLFIFYKGGLTDCVERRFLSSSFQSEAITFSQARACVFSLRYSVNLFLDRYGLLR